MQFRTSVILIALAILAIASSATPTTVGQHQHKQHNDAISGEWEATLITPDKNLQLALTLKLEGSKVTGSFESSHLGNGTITDGSWANNKLKTTLETSHSPLTLTGTLQNGKLTGEWDAVQMQ